MGRMKPPSPQVGLAVSETGDYPHEEIRMESDAPRERKLLHDAIESLRDGVVLFDKDDRFVFCNSAYRKDLEKIKNLLVPGTPYGDIVRAIAENGIVSGSIDDMEGFIRDRLAHFRNRESAIHHFAESDRWVMVNEYETSDGGTFHVRTDITEQKRIEQELKESQANFLAAIDNMAESFALFDADDRLIQCNRKYLEAFAPGLMDKDVSGMTFEELARISADNDFYPLNGRTKEEAIQDRLERHRNPRGPFEITRTDGRCFVYNENKIPGGGTVLLRRDITEQKQAEQLLTTAIESMPEGFAYYDADDRLALSNRKMKMMYPGMADLFVPGTPFEAVLRTGLERGQFPDAEGREEDWIREKLRYHQNPEGAVEYNLSDGRCIRVQEKRTPDGGVVGVRTDITEQKRIERELREARDELEKRVKERTRELSEMVK